MEDFEKEVGVTLAKPVAKGLLRPFGQVTGHATDPFTGKEQVMVLWPGAAKPLAYDPEELAVADPK